MTIPEVIKSKMTMMFRRFTRSAIIPPIGDSKAIGIIDMAMIEPKTAEEPVRLSK